jgi:hypothetical protein
MTVLTRSMTNAMDEPVFYQLEPRRKPLVSYYMNQEIYYFDIVLSLMIGFLFGLYLWDTF